MAVLPIYRFPHPILKQKAKRVRLIGDSVKRLINDMIETMHYVHATGLAAPQVGIPLRVIVVRIPEEQEKEDIVLINPKVVRRKGECLVKEGCLSIPGYFGEIKRAESITVKGLNPDGKEIRIKATGLLAEVLEHEIDHVNGVLYIDHIGSEGKLHKIEPETRTEAM